MIKPDESGKRRGPGARVAAERVVFSSWRWSVPSAIALMEPREVRAREVLDGAEARLRATRPISEDVVSPGNGATRKTPVGQGVPPGRKLTILASAFRG